MHTCTNHLVEATLSLAENSSEKFIVAANTEAQQLYTEQEELITAPEASYSPPNVDHTQQHTRQIK